MERNEAEQVPQETVDLHAETLTGDIRDYLLSRLKSFPKVWAEMTVEEQQSNIDAADGAARALVRSAVQLIAKDGRRTIAAELAKVTVKDGMKAEVDMSRHDPQRLELIDSVGKSVLIVVADAEQYEGEQAAATPDSDQREMFGDDKPVFDQTEMAAAE